MSISIPLIRALVETVKASGIDERAFLENAQFDPELLKNPNLRIEIDEYDRLQSCAVQMTGDQALGLHMGEAASMAAFSVVGYLFLNCRTVREALDIFFRYYRIISDCPQSQLIEEDRHAKIVYNFPRSTPLCNRIRGEFGITRLYRIGYLFGGAEQHFIEAGFEHEMPDYFSEYQRIFKGPILFEQPNTYIILNRDLLDIPQPHDNPLLYNILKSQADVLLSNILEKTTITEKIRLLIMEHYQGIRPDMETVARHFNMSSRSLRRKLNQENASFGAIIDEAMCDVAKNTLNDLSLSIKEASYRMGFSETSSFYRAFKRWTGMTPQQYRENPALK